MLTKAEKDLVIEYLGPLIAVSPRAMLLGILANDQLAIQLRTNLENAGAYAEHGVELAMRGGAQPVLKVLNFLIDKGKPIDPSLVQRIKHALEHPELNEDEPIAALVLENRLPFVDRDALRVHLRELASASAARPILMIGGTQGSGRSYAAHLVEHYCLSESDKLACVYPEKPEALGQLTPVKMALDLVTQLGGKTSDVPQRTSNEEHWFDELASWVVRNANNVDENLPNIGSVWIVLDGFHEDNVPEETKSFALSLAQKFSVGAAAVKHRLIFSDVTDDLERILPNKVRKTINEPVTRDHVRRTVSTIIAANDDGAEDLQLRIDGATDLVMKNMPDPVTDLTHIGRRLTALVRKQLNAGTI